LLLVSNGSVDIGAEQRQRRQDDDKTTTTYRSPSAKERLVSAFAGGDQNTIASTTAWHDARMRQEDLMIIIMDGLTGVSSIDESSPKWTHDDEKAWTSDALPSILLCKGVTTKN
jgi:hypothetical protein